MNDFPAMVNKIATAYNKPQVSMEDAYFLMNLHDKNKDGFIDMNEFTKMCEDLQDDPATINAQSQPGMQGQYGKFLYGLYY